MFEICIQNSVLESLSANGSKETFFLYEDLVK